MATVLITSLIATHGPSSSVWIWGAELRNLACRGFYAGLGDDFSSLPHKQSTRFRRYLLMKGSLPKIRLWASEYLRSHRFGAVSRLACVSRGWQALCPWVVRSGQGLSGFGSFGAYGL